MEKRTDILRSFLKRAGDEPEIGDLGYSTVMRTLRKKNPELVKPFMKSFKKAFDGALEERLENPENLALMQALKEVGVVEVSL